MPYIEDNLRRAILDAQEDFPGTPGELNYRITSLCRDYLKWGSLEGLSYATLNEIVGVLECAKLEFYRRMVVSYEDEKIKENGDVY